MKLLELQNTLVLPNCILKRGRDMDTIPIKRFFYPSSSRKQALYEHQPVALFNSSSPNISMPILHTVLYKFSEVLMRRICLTRKTFFHLLINFRFSSWIISVFDLAVLLWGEITSWALLGIKGLSLIAYSIVTLKLMSPIVINVPNRSNASVNSTCAKLCMYSWLDKQWRNACIKSRTCLYNPLQYIPILDKWASLLFFQ